VTNLADTPSTIITLVADGNLYQVTPNSTINIHKYRASIMLDQNGISSIVKIMNPSSVITINEVSNLVHVYTTGTLSAVFSSLNPITSMAEEHTVNISSLFMATAAYTSIVLTNTNTVQVAVRIYYS